MFTAPIKVIEALYIQAQRGSEFSSFPFLQTKSLFLILIRFFKEDSETVILFLLNL